MKRYVYMWVYCVIATHLLFLLDPFLTCSTLLGNVETIYLVGEDKEPMFFTMTGFGFVSYTIYVCNVCV